MLKRTTFTPLVVAIGIASFVAPAFAVEEHKSSASNKSYKFPPQVPAVVSYDYELNVRITQQNRKLTRDEWKTLLDQIVQDSLSDIIAKNE